MTCVSAGVDTVILHTSDLHYKDSVVTTVPYKISIKHLEMLNRMRKTSKSLSYLRTFKQCFILVVT